MNKKINAQVNPKVTALVILVVLVVIQFLWWRGLVSKGKPGHGGGGGGGGPLAQGVPVLTGRKDIQVDTLAGAPEPGDLDGPGRDARFDTPVALSLDAQGNLVVADCCNHRLRRVMLNGKTTTLTGSVPGFADGPLSAALFNLPCGVAVGPDDTIYVADTGNHRIRRIRDGQVSTLAGSSAGLAEGQGATARFDLPVAVAFGKGNQQAEGITLADAANHRVRLLDLTGKTVGGWDTPGTPLGLLTGKAAAIAAGGLLVPDGPRWRTVRNIPIDMQGKGPASPDFTLRRLVALCPARGGWFVVDAEQSGVFYLSMHGDRAILVAGRCEGRIRTPGWRDGNGETALFGSIGGIVTDGAGHLYLCDTSNNSIRRITLPQGSVER
jgi:hypothetical protein